MHHSLNKLGKLLNLRYSENSWMIPNAKSGLDFGKFWGMIYVKTKI